MRSQVHVPIPVHVVLIGGAGLNGSGKSNILDAICFVLGINNLSQVHREK